MNINSLLLLIFSLFLTVTHSQSIDRINATQTMRDGEKLVSARRKSVLEFFSPGNPENRYLGIRYGNIPGHFIWVANRENPVMDSSGILTITARGILVIYSGNGSIIWSSDSNLSMPAMNPVAQLLDSGNLVLRNDHDDNSENFLWQSFDQPSATLLPGMKLGKNRLTGLDRHISSWKSPKDPSYGNFTFRVDLVGYPEFILSKNSVKLYRSGPWNGQSFSGQPYLKSNQLHTNVFFYDKEEVYYSFQLNNQTIISRLLINSSGILLWTVLNGRHWTALDFLESDLCDRYRLCGSYGICDVNNTPPCSCLEGFVPKNPKAWEISNWSEGCVSKIQNTCSSDAFQLYSGVKLPEMRNAWFNDYKFTSMSLEDCKNLCSRNCSCVAYANMDITGEGSGCFLWYGELVDMRKLATKGQDIYISTGSPETVNSKSNSKKHIWIAMLSLTVGFLFLVACAVYCWKRRKRGIVRSKNNGSKEDLDLPQLDFHTLSHATDNFSISNKLGEGGFGPVYKGMLKDGQQIAVKRLSRNSRQGPEQFKNEIRHIAKLQHRNLVKLLGYCIHADDMMLIYEFMPNKSLDFFIFDQTRRLLLDWPKRYQIINGIARGLLYLHQDSRLRIVHRDLKTSNILLDHDMNPKISDFGLARSFGGAETAANTTKVVGTYGYMSPEYMIQGLFSVKSDVFSFGVVVLEILSGKRNRGFLHQDHLSLLGYAWRLYQEGRSMEIISECLRDSCNVAQAIRLVEVGLLCVQSRAEDRPSMSTVAIMLSGESALPKPKQPGFFSERDIMEVDGKMSLSSNEAGSANEVSLSVFEAR